MPTYKPKEIAAELGISMSALRRYEAWGVVPPPERAPNGYRLYTHVHLAYFRCLRAMIPGFGYPLSYDALRHIRNARPDEAFWLVTAEQAKLHEERRTADRTLALLQNPELMTTFKDKKIKSRMTIGEAAAVADVEPSAIRHWEREGLIRPERSPDNGYRIYTPVQVRQILLIRTLRKTVYYLDRMKEIVRAVEHRGIEQAREAAANALVSLHRRNRQQLNGIRFLMVLCDELGRGGGDAPPQPRERQSFDRQWER